MVTYSSSFRVKPVSCRPSVSGTKPSSEQRPIIDIIVYAQLEGECLSYLTYSYGATTGITSSFNSCPFYQDPLEELLQALLRDGLPGEHSNLHSRISMEDFPRSFFSPTRWSSTLILFRNASMFYFKSAGEVHYILPGLSSKTRALWELSYLLETTCIRLCLMCPSCLLGAACKSLACIRLCPQGQSYLHALSTSCRPDVCDIRTSYVSRQCTSSDGDRLAAPYLLRGLATPDWLFFAS
ncbi:hypothetical protein Tco_0039755 [Tanacetum coccineum]